MKRKILAGVVLCLVLAVLIPGCKPRGKPSGESGATKYKIALSNSYMGNDWRQVMLKTTEVIAGKEPYKSKVDLTIVNCENNPEAQAASIDAMIEQDYDAILINASSATGLNPAINRAKDAGIVVVVFDNVVENPNTHIVHLATKKKLPDGQDLSRPSSNLAIQWPLIWAFREQP